MLRLRLKIFWIGIQARKVTHIDIISVTKQLLNMVYPVLVPLSRPHIPVLQSGQLAAGSSHVHSSERMDLTERARGFNSIIFNHLLSLIVGRTLSYQIPSYYYIPSSSPIMFCCFSGWKKLSSNMKGLIVNTVFFTAITVAQIVFGILVGSVGKW